MAELDQLHETEMAVRKECHILELLIAADLERLPEDVVTPRILVKVLDRLSEAISAAGRSGNYGTVERLASGLREGHRRRHPYTGRSWIR